MQSRRGTRRDREAIPACSRSGGGRGADPAPSASFSAPRRPNLPNLARHYREASPAARGAPRIVQIKLFELEDRRSTARGLEQQYAEAMRGNWRRADRRPATQDDSAVREYLAKPEYLDLAYQEPLRIPADARRLGSRVPALIDRNGSFPCIDERVLVQAALGLGDLVLSCIAAASAPTASPGWRTRWSVSGLRTPGISGWSIWRCSACSSVFFFFFFFFFLGHRVAACRRHSPATQLGRNAATSAHVRIWPTIRPCWRPFLSGRLSWTSAVLLLPGTGWLWLYPGQHGRFARAVGSGCLHLAEWWLPRFLAVMAQLCRPQGLANRISPGQTERSGQYGTSPLVHGSWTAAGVSDGPGRGSGNRTG